jgi:SAM-dependent methyltransferase
LSPAADRGHALAAPSPAGPADPASPFDALAAGYDADFTHSDLGARLRQAVWRRADARFAVGDRVLDLGCGTGEDAVHLARRGVRVTALDASAAMVEAARRKVAAAGLDRRVEVVHRRLEELGEQGPVSHPGPGPLPGRRLVLDPLGPQPDPPPEPPHATAARYPRVAAAFDGALADFGVLNCVADLPSVAAALAGRLRPGAALVASVMGPWVPWEWAWFLARARPRRALVRLARGGARWRSLAVRYPTPGRLERAVAPAVRLDRLAALGALVPPPYAGGWAARHPALLARLERWERRFETWPPLPWLADHYLAELVRR